MLLFCSAVSTDLIYTDEGKKSYSYYDFGLGSYLLAKSLCDDLGGQFPIVFLAGKQNFLNINFVDNFRIGLVLYVFP